jgi:acetyl-CoA acetyltransferase
MVVEIPVKKGNPMLFSQDEFVKPNTTTEGLVALKPAFKKDGGITAGNSAGLNDGAAAMLIATEAAINRYGLKPKARMSLRPLLA